jgi:hypothetical protein
MTPKEKRETVFLLIILGLLVGLSAYALMQPSSSASPNFNGVDWQQCGTLNGTFGSGVSVDTSALQSCGGG